jgi:hypothetical protein
MQNTEIIFRNTEFFICPNFGHNKNLTKEQYNKIEQIQELSKDIINTRKYLNALYLDYVNNYVTIEYMAEHECLSVEDLKVLLSIGKKINNKEY